MSEAACKSTDRELWREKADDYYSPSIHVTERGGIGINVGGRVVVQNLRDWHAAACAPNVPPVRAENKGRFQAELYNLINKYSMENGSNTPDFILSKYLVACLDAFNEAVTTRTEWYAPEKPVCSNPLGST